jgi:glutamate racemase
MYDSGAGGLAVLAELRRLLPGENVVYFADNGFFPYGPRPASEIRQRADAVTRELLARGAKLIVVACNTATSAAIAHLRATFDVPFVGMEPALKPAAERTLSGKVALLVTPGTARGEKLAALIDRYGAEVSVRTIEAPGLAERVEAGDVDSDETRELVRRYLAPVRDSGADVLVLGCTHYAFLRDVIEREVGDGATLIEPSEAVARQVKRVLSDRRLRNPRAEGGEVLYLCSGDADAFAALRASLEAGTGMRAELEAGSGTREAGSAGVGTSADRV